MARRIVSVQPGIRASGLSLNDKIDMQWQKVIDDRNDWNYELTLIEATWEITKAGEKFSRTSSYGQIVDDENRRWIRWALEGDGPVAISSPYVARVNEIQCNDHREPQVIKVEVMTGPDAEAFLRAEKINQQIDMLKKNRLPILFAALVVLWWFS